jgi:hypothetical protein
VATLEPSSGVLRNNLRQRRLARARWAGEEDAREPIRRQHSIEQHPFTQKVLLAGEFVQRSRPHSHRQRRY